MYRASEADLVDFWKKKHIPSTDRCKMENQDQKDRKPTPINLTQLSSAFAILSVGIVMAILAYIFEIIFSLRQSANVKNKLCNKLLCRPTI